MSSLKTIVAVATASVLVAGSVAAGDGGLTATVKAEKAEFRADEHLRFVVSFTNQSKEDLVLPVAEFLGSQEAGKYTPRFRNVVTGQPWRFRVFPSSAPARLYQETIKPGATLDLTYTFPGNFLTGEGAGPVTTAPHLPAGKYELALTIEVNGAVLTPKPAAFTMVETPTPKPLTKEETEKIIGQARQALAQNLARQVEAEKKADVNSGVPYASLTAASFVVEIERGGAGHIVKFRADLPNSDRVLTWTVGVTERGVDPNFAMYGFVSIPKHPALAPAPAAGPGTRLLQLQ